jgi:hypothetical protein
VRSTFVTRRSFLLDLDTIATAIGQTGKRAAAHYDYPEPEALAKKLMYADVLVETQTDVLAPVRSGPAFVKAASINSALVQGFRADREQAIRSFGIVALGPPLSTPDKTEALELLRTSPLAHITFRDTHICPVGEHCPEEVVKLFGQKRRCGACPLACKSVDHLPAIAAVQRMLIERVRSNLSHYKRMRDRGDQDSALASLHDTIVDDYDEYVAWKIAEESLWIIYAKLGDAATEQLHVFQPELVREHLRRVVAPTNEREFLLRRILEADAYPTMATDRLRQLAERMKRRMFVSMDVEHTNLWEDGPDDVTQIASSLRIYMEAKQISLEEVAERMQGDLSNRLPAARVIDHASLSHPDAGA